jgi:hypothetical protein
LEETIEYRGGEIEILYDKTPMSPREWDNLGHMICWHRRYHIGDDHSFQNPLDLMESISGLDRESSLKDTIFQKAHENAVILPIYIYDHSGITIKTTPFQCRWDSGFLGYIYATKEDIRENWGIKRVTQKYLDWAKKILEGEVQVTDEYIRGDVYGFNAYYKDADDSCWGFYGDEGKQEAINEAKSFIDYRKNQEKKQKFEKLKALIRNNVPVHIRPQILSEFN